MTTRPHTRGEKAFSNTVDAFMAVSGVYLDCTEQLSHNAVAVTRAALEECAAAARHAAAAKGGADPLAFPVGLGQSLMEKALACTRDGYEVLTKAQLESARIIRDQFTASAIAIPVVDEWKGAVDMFSRAFRDFSAQASNAFADAGAFPAGRAPHVNKAA